MGVDHDHDLTAAPAVELAIVRRGVETAREIPGGWVLRHPELPEVWQLNRIHLRDAIGDLDAGALAALADHWLAGVEHRRVTLDDVAGADALWPALERGGWRRERAIAMVLRDGGPRAPVDPRVTRLTEAELSALQRRAFAEDATVTAISAELPDRLAAAQTVLRAGTEAQGFGASPARGVPPSCCATLYLDPDVAGRRVALIDQVATLRPDREQGLATAVLGAAIRAAGEWRADTIGLFADADDWPQIMYAGMGFTPVARQVVVHRDI